MQIERHDPSPAKVLRRSTLHTVGGLLIAAAFGLGLPLALLLCGGCYSVFTAETEAVPLNAAQIAAFKDMDPQVAAGVLKVMQGTTYVDSIDVMTQADRRWKKSIDATGVRTYDVTANHRTDAEAIAALGQQVNALAQSLAPLAQAALKAAVVAPVPAAPGGAAAGTTPPAAVPAGAPPGSTVKANPDDPSGWRPTDLLVKQSVNMKRAMSLAANRNTVPQFGLRAPTSDEAARFSAGLLQLQEFLGIVGADWASDARVRD